MSPPNPPPAAKEVASARKRRRRAPAGGAADDCFTCAKRNVKCDRRRPYCSQCLEIGNECSGYKTQLTWGVGVASRGKLRGLSLPIAKAPPVNPVKKDMPSPAPTRLRTGSTASSTQWPEHDEKSEGRRPEELPLSPGSSVPPTPFYEMPHIPSPETASAIPPSHGWTHIQYPPVVTTENLPRFSNRHLHVSVPPSNEMLPPMMESITEVNYMSPLDQSFRREDMHFIHSPTVLYETSYPGHSSPVPVPQSPAIMIESQRVPTTCPGLVYSPSDQASSLHSSSLQSHVDPHFDAQMGPKMMDCDALTKLEHPDFQSANSLIRKMSVSAAPELDAYSTSAQSQGPFWAPPTTEEEVQAQSLQEHAHSPWPLSIPRPPPSPSIQVNPDLISRMPFFMDYYENTLCPTMVFIDTPNNPFREHILRLSSSSRGLQHAICALSACNLRMKRKLSRGQHGRDIGEKRIDAISESNDAQPEDQSLTEEYQHRNLAVQLLNEQLNDNDKAMHDSALATILLLCHYRMAESGVAKFQTQFAGVKKILGMRRNSLFPASRDSAWMECLFTYFDAVSASINDREAQLNTAFYGVLPDAQLLPPGAENLVGCDRELFKTISKLGRLNLLSQHRPVQNLLGSPAQSAGGIKRSDTPLSSLGNTFQPSPSDPLGFDTHIFSPAVTSPGNRFDSSFGTAMNEDDMMSPATLQSPGGAYDDHRSTFWREWKEARIALQSWEYDASRTAASLPNMPTAPTSSQMRDLGSLSEAFRYAALLYTERLASPNVPSAHTNFRNLVSQVVYYATSLEAGSHAEKFLLWPLFVAGSECVNELQQNIVRSKCRDIMARSGYMNNLAALDVLERLWAGDWKEDQPKMLGGSLMRRGPFNWTKCIGGPGVDVEWIMF
ncbi:hypothetical protein GQ53DRAFT_439064 [Thozetella sp. PMI_491]|nr:hypothetical protein GQ53DRAFT_439064 [Thozetella sp. PMI_491]